MRRAALAQVDLDGVGLPRPPVRARHDEVEREAAEHALLRETLADLRRLAADGRRRTPRRPGTGSRGSSGRSGRRASGRGSRAARPSPSGVTRSCTLGLRISSASMRSSTMPCCSASFSRKTAYARLWSSKRHARAGAARTASRSPAAPAGGRPTRSRLALPVPDTPSFSLITTRLSRRALARACATIASTRSSSVARSSRPSGCGTPSSRNRRRALLFVPRSTRRGSQPYIGMPEPQRQLAVGPGRREGHEVRAVRVRGSARGSARAAAGGRAASGRAGAARRRAARRGTAACARGSRSRRASGRSSSRRCSGGSPGP